MATLYAKAAGGNWTSASTWSNTGSGGADNSGPPGATTDVVFQTGSTGTVTVNTACLAKTLTCQGSGNKITFGSGNTLTAAGNVAFYAGMTLTGTGTLKFNVASASLDSGGVTFPGAIDLGTSIQPTISLLSNLTCSGHFSSATAVLNNNTLTCNGGLSAGGGYGISGTTAIKIGGSGGVVSGTIGGTGTANSLTFDCTSATVTSLYCGGGATIAYTAGTITTTGSTLYVVGPCSLATNGMTWDVICTGNGSFGITLASNLACNSLQIGPPNSNTTITSTFSGPHNISCGTLSSGSPWAAPHTLVLVAGQTLAVTNAIQLNGNSTYATSIQSATPSSQAYLKYQGTPNNCSVYQVSFTDVNASSGNKIYDWGGTILRTANISNIDGTIFNDQFDVFQ